MAGISFLTGSATLGLLVLGCLLAIIAVIELLLPGRMPTIFCDAISEVMNTYLCHRYPIKHQDGVHNLPTCPYRWPNGQGDYEKFLEGEKNSAFWKQKYGDVYRIWSGTQSEVVLTQPHQLQAIFRDSNKHIKAKASNSGAYMERLLGKCVGLISGQEWQQARTVVEVPFGHKLIAGRVANVDRLIQEHFADLGAHGRLRAGILHPADDMKMLPFWVVGEVFYGRLSEPLRQQLRDLAPLREKLFRHVIYGGLTRFSWARYLPTAANKELNTFQTRWRQFNQDALAYAKASRTSAPIIHMYEAVDAGEVTEEQMLQTLDESLYANLDVTTGGLSWNMIFLAAHPDVQASLYQEARAAQANDRLDTYYQSETTLLSASILESGRLKPLAAFSVPQAAPTARVVDGYVIPAGTNFVIDSYALNIHSDTWAPDNTTYRPGRFLEKKKKAGGSELRYRFWRFGFGPRQCMGKYVADLMIRQTLTYVLLNYELGWLDNKEEWGRNRDVWISHPDFALRCQKRQ